MTKMQTHVRSRDAGRPKARDLAARGAAVFALLAVPLLLACGPTEPAPGTDANGADRAFAVDRVVVGVGFDERVRVEESGSGTGMANGDASTAAVQIAEVVLTPGADAGRFAGSMRFSGSSGATAEIRLLVGVDEAAGGVAADGADSSAWSAGSVAD